MNHPLPKIGVLIEEHFDPDEYRCFNSYFPSQGLDVEYLSHLWGNDSLTFSSNPTNGVVEESVTVSAELDDADPADYAGIILIGGYAMDRLRYQPNVVPGGSNESPAVRFLRKCMATPSLKVGTICHSLWLFCADPTLLAGRKVTCAHNVICDVENAGGIVQYAAEQTRDLVVDGNLISCKHPGIVDKFVELMVSEIRATADLVPAV